MTERTRNPGRDGSFSLGAGFTPGEVGTLRMEGHLHRTMRITAVSRERRVSYLSGPEQVAEDVPALLDASQHVVHLELAEPFLGAFLDLVPGTRRGDVRPRLPTQ
jgi:hypothetical protein